MHPDFWIEIHYHDDTSIFNPFLGDRSQAMERCARLVAMDAHQLIESVLLLRGDYIPQSIATGDQILEVFQGYPGEGFREWKPKKHRN